MPLTGAERQKRYMEKMKEKNPEKYESKRKKHLEYVKKKQKKIIDLTEEEKSAQRNKWRIEKSKKSKTTLKKKRIRRQSTS